MHAYAYDHLGILATLIYTLIYTSQKVDFVACTYIYTHVCNHNTHVKYICVEFDPGSFMYVVGKYAWDFYMKNTNF